MKSMRVDPLPALPETPYWRVYQGRFQGFPTWPMFDRFWPVLRAAKGEWYVLDIDAGLLPEKPIDEAGLAAMLDRVEDMYAPARDRSFCGVVFADDATAPGFVKLFDPWNMGASCGSSGERILPRFVLSRMKPDALPVAEVSVPPKKGLMARFTGRG